MKKKIVVLHNQICNNTPDEIDVLSQRDLVKDACIKLGFDVLCLTVGDDLQNDIQTVALENPEIVFNLVESTWGKGELIYFAPAILNSLKIPYTGVPLDALFVTTNKVLAKKTMQLNHLPTADFFSMDDLDQLDPKKTYIAKPIWEEASLGISPDYIFNTTQTDKLKTISHLSSCHYFIETFIEGREFNVSILADKNMAEVLPPAEMIFSSYFDDKPKIVGYKAKWDQTSEEYKQTNRVFGTLENTPALKDTLIEICAKSWDVFNLKGYARIDFRVDEKDNVYILEINGNPCISDDSGFIAATRQAGYSVETIISRIIENIS
ncbi:MAG: ATP-grasp domain-containing protein [Pseudomonadota bacterium]